MGLQEMFERASREGRRMLIPYVTAGYPSFGAFQSLLRTIAQAGADAIEIGVPFSDPVADGPTIQEASFQALRQGAHVERILSALEGLRLETPVILMSYVNVILQYGAPRFFRRCRSSGILGVVVPDLPIEESRPFERRAAQFGLDLVHLVAPTTPPERVRKIAARTRGFLYLVSVTGVTGSRPILNGRLRRMIAAIRRATDKPVCVGFGVSSPTQAARVCRWADGVIVGSALTEVVRRHRGKPELGAYRFVRELREAIDQARKVEAT
jgi:tryptophan synthase alpha chain